MKDMQPGGKGNVPAKVEVQDPGMPGKPSGGITVRDGGFQMNRGLNGVGKQRPGQVG